jgi:two-component system, OmpR family, response regulator
MHVLLIEDNQIVREAVTAALHAHDFSFDIAMTGHDGWMLGATQDYDCAILDLVLPDMDGLTILQRWRAENVTMPVLVLTSRGRWFERVEGLNLGADDYLVKPFRIAELVARISSIVRRSKGNASAQIQCHGLVVDLQNQTVATGDGEIALGPLEWRVIALLAQNKGAFVSAQRLIDYIYGINSDKSANALEALIKRLRQKLPGDLIRTRRGAGYMIAGPGGARLARSRNDRSSVAKR